MAINRFLIAWYRITSYLCGVILNVKKMENKGILGLDPKFIATLDENELTQLSSINDKYAKWDGDNMVTSYIQSKKAEDANEKSAAERLQARFK